MVQSEFKAYADRELVKSQRYKQVWKSATNPKSTSRCISHIGLLKENI